MTAVPQYRLTEPLAWLTVDFFFYSRPNQAPYIVRSISLHPDQRLLMPHHMMPIMTELFLNPLFCWLKKQQHDFVEKFSVGLNHDSICRLFQHLTAESYSHSTLRQWVLQEIWLYKNCTAAHLCSCKSDVCTCAAMCVFVVEANSNCSDMLLK